MKTDCFDFKLPKELIAQKPCTPRDAAKLLHIGECLRNLTIRDLPNIMSSKDILVLNNTKVIPARLKGLRNKTSIEITLHKLNSDKTWRAFAKPARKLRTGDSINFSTNFSATVLEKKENGEIVVSFSGKELFNSLNKYGSMPLPPYIKRKNNGTNPDELNYQTVYASNLGAVAAPTAGLHFSKELIEQIKSTGIDVVELTLHVGAGTFLPVKVENIHDHAIHSEWGKLNKESVERINLARKAGGRVTACGTTVLRLLESAVNENGELEPFEGETDIFITPGYKFKIVDRLITNFHLPRSTLIMLVAAFTGLERIKSAYEYAIKSGYRFYSYGDASLLERKK
ncbi:MAG: tRNA preQ1(34) S-adenosylmethionine ribosyltransferase-isomerase QueA [Rhodospirillaceae bacterium]|nr:tRNA preQ1(34) S-adenosylmethionine ribosyltransferase-isomerase QueA [Rhodospirillaceae bacterium]